MVVYSPSIMDKDNQVQIWLIVGNMSAVALDRHPGATVPAMGGAFPSTSSRIVLDHAYKH